MARVTTSASAKRMFLLTTALISCPLPLAAQTSADAVPPPSDSASDDASAITVTATRVNRLGFIAPTPTTVIDQTKIEKSGLPNIADVINQMPAVRATLTPASSSNNTGFAGGNYLDLRGLGRNRTLVLVDGKRFVPGQIEGAVNINAIPQVLISSVEIVTGGASAAWGSDAVAGVVNLHLNTKLSGFSGSLQKGVSSHGDYGNYRGSIAFGTRVGDAGHLVLAGEAAENDGVLSQASRDWGAQRWGLIANPDFTATNNEPRNLLLPGVLFSNQTFGGLINAGPLANRQFAPDGSLVPFVAGTPRTSTRMVGGDGADDTDDLVLSVPIERQSLYGRFSYELGEATSLYIEAGWSRSETRHPGLVRSDTALRISRDNAFIPASLRQEMLTRGLTSVTVGRRNRDYARVFNDIEATTQRYVAGLDGKLGDGWSWDAYYTYGRTRNRLLASNNRITTNFNLALDSIVDPQTNQPVCRSAAARAAGCVPINIFGDGAPSQAARAYVNGTAQRDWDIRQHAAAATLRGEPFSTWAGPVSWAAGVEWRRETAEVTSDALSQAGAFAAGNTDPWKGGVTVKEGFTEFVVPLAKDMPFFKSLDVNFAARLTDYSTSGSVTTWKAGATWDISDSLRLRATWSRDIRAPSLSELFSAGSTALFTVNDPQLGRSYSVQARSGGNASLEPERADTLTAGLVVQPAFLPRLRLSVDYYDIKMKKAILALTAGSTVNRCFDDQPELCALITRGANGEISQIDITPQNVQLAQVRGIDFEAAYSVDGLGGTWNTRILATYTDRIRLDDRIAVQEFAGSVDQPTVSSIGGIPRWRSTFDLDYETGPLRLGVTTRFIGAANLDNTFTEKSQNILRAGERFYFDLSVGYDFLESDKQRMQLFATVQNLFDRDPPITGGGFATTRSIYDVIGRTYTVGLRFKY